MTFLTILGVTEISCSFRLVVERKTGKKELESWRLEFLEKFLVNNFALSDAEDNSSKPLNRGGVTDLSLLRALLAIHQTSQNQDSGKWWTLCFSSIWEFGSFKNSFTSITNMSEVYFKLGRSVLLVQMKKVISFI